MDSGVKRSSRQCRLADCTNEYCTNGFCTMERRLEIYIEYSGKRHGNGGQPCTLPIRAGYSL